VVSDDTAGVLRWFAVRTDLRYTAWQAPRMRRRIARLLPPAAGTAPGRAMPLRLYSPRLPSVPHATTLCQTAPGGRAALGGRRDHDSMPVVGSGTQGCAGSDSGKYGFMASDDVMERERALRRKRCSPKQIALAEPGAGEVAVSVPRTVEPRLYRLQRPYFGVKLPSCADAVACHTSSPEGTQHRLSGCGQGRELVVAIDGYRDGDTYIGVVSDGAHRGVGCPGVQVIDDSLDEVGDLVLSEVAAGAKHR
jgi:hypothetical protein